MEAILPAVTSSINDRGAGMLDSADFTLLEQDHLLDEGVFA